MTGAYDSSLGMDKSAAVTRFVSGENVRLFPAVGERQINAVVVETDDLTNKAKSIKRLNQIYPGEF